MARSEPALRKNPWGGMPRVHPSAYVDPSAIIIGGVRIGRDVFVGPGAVIRADEKGSSITIGDRCNIQDRVIVHALGGSKVAVSAETSLSHGSIVHGPCRIGKGCFIGFGAVVFKAVLGAGVFVDPLAVIQERDIPAGMKALREADALVTAGRECEEFSKKVVKTNLELVGGYKALK